MKLDVYEKKKEDLKKPKQKLGRQRTKRIIQYDLNRNIVNNYYCVNEAVINSNKEFTAYEITKCCIGKSSSYKSFIFEYDESR